MKKSKSERPDFFKQPGMNPSEEEAEEIYTNLARHDLPSIKRGFDHYSERLNSEEEWIVEDAQKELRAIKKVVDRLNLKL